MIFPSELVPKPQRAETEPGPVYSFLKRMVDVIGSSIGLLILTPVFAILAVAIKVDSRGPVFYEQER
ncbi:MAG TPA: sugar transferase, partial [Candidatus Udaeobacter sp.]|nr:sugar transferase [Candidatus Udaeobacter sp.]